jgi:hypothetical protein
MKENSPIPRRQVEGASSFLQVYMDYTANQESPALFHLWTSITILAASLGRKCYINRGYYRLYPNFFTVLVAGSASCRKSTAVNIGVRLLDGIESVKIIDGKITPEKLTRQLAEDCVEIESNGTKQYQSPTAFVHSGELSVFLTKQSYGEPIIHLLTDLFDCPDHRTYRTKNKGTDEVYNVFMGILAATTPDGIAKGIPQSAMHEGFASRIMFVFQPDTDRENAFPELTPQELHMHLQLKAMLLERASIEGEFILDEQAKAWFRNWYSTHRKTPVRDKRLEGMHGRKHDHLLRLGMVLAADRLATVVEEHHLDAALTALNKAEDLAPGAFSEMGGNETTDHVAKVRTVMRRFQRLGRSALMRKVFPIDAPTFKTVLETLYQTGEIVYDPENSTIVIWIEHLKD